MPPKRIREGNELMFAGFLLSLTVEALKYTALLEYLGANFKNLGTVRTLQLFEAFYADSHELINGHSTINMDELKKTVLTPDERTLANNKVLGIDTGLMCLLNVILQETHHFDIDAKIYFAALQQHMRATGVPKPNEHNQSFQWFIEAAKEQADETWAASMAGAQS
jgi:hypothetical protein